MVAPTDAPRQRFAADLDVPFASAVDLLRAYRARRLSPVEVVERVLRHAEALNPAVGAFVTLTPEVALAAAREAERGLAHDDGGGGCALLGVPVSIKDVVPTAGIRTTMGSRLFADWVPNEDAPLVRRLRDAGAVIVGKTNVPELGWKGDSGNPIGAPTRNPFDLACTAGGSSGGAAAAVATGMGPLAQGGDGAGSIRIPAALSGVFGFKPSHGRVPYAPAGALELLVAEGPITRSVADAALMLDALSGFDPADRLSLPPPERPFAEAVDRHPGELRVAFCPNLGGEVDPGVADVVQRAVRCLEDDLGFRVEPVDPPWDDPLAVLEVFFASAYAGLHADGYGAGHDPQAALELLDPGLAALVRRGQELGAPELTAAHLELLRLCDRARAFMDDWDLLASPTLPVTAFAAGLDQPPGSPGPYAWLGTTYPFNLTGQPAASVPAGFADGLPVGLQLAGRLRDDETVLGACAAFERARPWHESLREATSRLLAADLRATA
jgi:aspartyl-tRNA(Asn)/glutamyl-tRNA(Gln) amidotransferase subunit A